MQTLFSKNSNNCWPYKKKYYNDAPIEVITQITFDINTDSLLNDSLFNATYFLTNCIKLQQLTDHLMLPSLSDITYFKQSRDLLLLHGSSSLYTHFSVPKPLFFAANFFTSLHKIILHCGPYHIISADANNNIHILLFNHKFPDSLYCTNPEIKIEPEQYHALFPNLPPEKYEITFTNLAEDDYFIEVHTLNQNHGSILDNWINSGMPPSYSPESVEHLKANIHPKYEYQYIKSKGPLKLTYALDSLEIKYISIFPSNKYHLLPL